MMPETRPNPRQAAAPRACAWPRGAPRHMGKVGGKWFSIHHHAPALSWCWHHPGPSAGGLAGTAPAVTAPLSPSPPWLIPPPCPMKMQDRRLVQGKGPQEVSSPTWGSHLGQLQGHKHQVAPGSTQLGLETSKCGDCTSLGNLPHNQAAFMGKKSLLIASHNFFPIHLPCTAVLSLASC